ADCTTVTDVGFEGSPCGAASSTRRYAVPSNTSTTFVDSRRSTVAVRSSRKGGVTLTVAVRLLTANRRAGGSGAHRVAATSRVPRDLRALLAHQPAHDGGVPRELLDVGRVHRDLPRHRDRRAVGHVAQLPVDQRLGLPANGVHVRPVDARSRAEQHLLLHHRQRPRVRARRTLRPLPGSPAGPAVPGDHRSAADLARRADPCHPLLLRRRAVRGGSRRRAAARLRPARRARRFADRLRRQPRDRHGVVLVHARRLAALGVHVDGTGVFALPPLDLPARRAHRARVRHTVRVHELLPGDVSLAQVRGRIAPRSRDRAVHSRRRRGRPRTCVRVLARRLESLQRDGELSAAGPQRPPGTAAKGVRMELLTATYLVETAAARIDERAAAIALEQSVECPLDAVHDARVREEVVGRVGPIERVDERRWRVEIELAMETTGYEPAQLVNMISGNSSLWDDVRLVDVDLPPALLAAFRGPRHGVAGLRALAAAPARALTAVAVKPQGLPVRELARLCGVFAEAGIDVVKDDHGISDQSYSPYPERVRACQAAVADASRATGRASFYAP